MSSEKLYLTQAGLAKLVHALREDGARVIAPVLTGKSAGGPVSDYREVKDAEQVLLDGPLPRRSLKELFLPATEPLLRWRQEKSEVHTEDPGAAHRRTVVLGAYACDAAALPVLDRVMGWDYRDGPWFGRREATTVISRACSVKDSSCFCGSVGLAPDSTNGADLLLVPAGDHGTDHIVEVITPAGEALVAAHRDLFEAHPSGGTDAEDRRREAARRVSENIDVDTSAIRTWLESNFDHEVWAEISDRCHGCGACAAVCPTCHCFDIVDEPDGIDHGTRRRNWDTCQTGLFTLHGSGHNPRTAQDARCRQRIMHKFAIYPKRFDAILCTGCGRCARACAAGMDLPDNLQTIHRLASPSEDEVKKSSGGVG